MPTDFDVTTVRAQYHEPVVAIDGVPQGDPLSYRRDFQSTQTKWTDRRGWIQNAGATANRSILVVGCAFGFLIEALIDDGFTDVWGIDPGSYWWANTDQFRPDVLPRVANGTVGVDHAAALAAIGAPSTFQYVVDDDAASSQSEGELPGFHSALEDLLQGGAHGRIWHLVTPLLMETGMLFKTAAEWKATAPSHSWFDLKARTVI